MDVEQRQRETSIIIIAFKIQALCLLMSAYMIDDKEFVCRVGTVPLLSTTGALPASGSLPITDADVFNTSESDQESLDNSAAASDHMTVDGDYDGYLPGDASPSKRARTASSSSYAEFISGTAARNAIASRSLTTAGSQKMFGRDAIGNGYDIIRKHTALILPDTRYPESRFLDRISVEKVLHNMIVPVLHFTGHGSVISFRTLHHNVSSAVYVVIADCCDSVTNMKLIYRDPAFATRYFPQRISFEHGIYSQPVTILVYSELALRTGVLEEEIQDALTSNGISYPIAPSTSTSVAGSLLLTASGVIEKSDGKLLAEWLSLRRALHSEKMKIQALTQGDPDMKISNPRLMTRMRNNSQLADNNIFALPIIHADSAPD